MKTSLPSSWIVTAVVFVALFSAGFSLAEESGLHNESEAGVIVTSGNTRANTFNFKQKNSYGWNGSHLLKFEGSFLDSTSFGVKSAHSYSLGLRFEEMISDRFSLYLGQNLESDIFAGYIQRYNTDVGGKYQILKQESLAWNAESGYRYTVENQTNGDQTNKSFLRAYSDINKDINKTVSARLSLEYLANLSNFSDTGSTQKSRSQPCSMTCSHSSRVTS